MKTDYIKTNIDGDLKLEFPTLIPDKNGNPVVWYVVHQNAYSGLIQADNSLEKNENVMFEFQSIENDSTEITFANAVYPNPFSNLITVSSLEEDIFIITSPTGSVIYQQKVHNGINRIDVFDLPKGLYFGELKNQRFVTKLERL